MLADDPLIGPDAQGPPIDWLGLSIVEQRLSCDVLRKLARRVRARVGLPGLGGSENRELQIAVGDPQDILGLQAPVNDTLAVDVLEGVPDPRAGEFRLGTADLTGLATTWRPPHRELFP